MTENTKVLASLRVSPEIHAEVLSTSKEDDRSIQDQIRFLLKLGLKVRKQILDKNVDFIDNPTRRNYVRKSNSDSQGKS